MGTTLGQLDGPRTARLAVAACFSRASTGQVCADSAGIMTSEVVTNALMHGSAPVTLGVHCGTDLLRAEVGDEELFRPIVHAVDDEAEGATVHAVDDNVERGRGMRIVDALASAWGVIDTRAGEVVWFEVSTQP